MSDETTDDRSARLIRAEGAVVVLLDSGGDDSDLRDAADRAAEVSKILSAGGEHPPDEVSVTQHEVAIEGRAVAYEARAGRMTIDVEGDEETGKAAMFYVSYTRTDVEDTSGRPIVFAFNGGPGSSSVWLHMGLLGPRRVELPDDAGHPRPPCDVIPNPHSLLDVADLVFIDPVTTGYSRPLDKDEGAFHGVSADVRSVGEFIRRFLTEQERWASPKFLAGESYGTTRAAALSGHLQDKMGIYPNGIILISSVLEFMTILPHPDNDLPLALFLPAYAATAWFHGALDDLGDRELRDVLDEVERFALGDYASALLRGDRLSEDERSDIAQRVARYAGLSEEFVHRANLRVTPMRFFKELLRSRGLTVGRLDSRYTGMDRDAAGEHIDTDPSFSAIQGVYTAALNDHVRRELRYETDLTYEILTDRVRPWKFDPAENRYLDVAETLRAAMVRNPHLRLFVANGYYDLATPYFATEHTISHLGPYPGGPERVAMHYYEAGHMMYVHEPSLSRLGVDLRAFVRESLAGD